MDKFREQFKRGESNVGMRRGLHLRAEDCTITQLCPDQNPLLPEFIEGQRGKNILKHMLNSKSNITRGTASIVECKAPLCFVA